MGRSLCLALLSLCSAAAASEGNWCYLSQKCQHPGCTEPRQWDHLTSECGKKKQSPINILTSEVKYDWELQPFQFENYDVSQNTNWLVENNGHTVQVTLDKSAKISSGGLEGKYKAVQFHFHWGNSEGPESDSRASPGSEHSIDGKRYPVELHIVHIQDKYSSIKDAIDHKGVAVLGFFIEAGEDENDSYKPLLGTFDNIHYKGNSTKMQALCLSSLIPKMADLTSFYRYIGSLTTPDCNEDVIWTIFEKPIVLNLKQIEKFWKELYFGNNTQWAMVDNFRPVQPVNDRLVTKSETNALLPPGKVLLLIPTAAYLALSVIQ